MNFNRPLYVKSLESDLSTQRLVNGVKQPFQSIEEMVHPSMGGEPTIQLNTVSFGQADRLACTVLNREYTQTYRPQGIIFQTKAKPDHVSPFDLMVLANVPGEHIVADYYRIVANLKEHYGRALIPGYEQFLYTTPEEMLRDIPNPEAAWTRVNAFRVAHGLSQIPASEKKLVSYNEAIFYTPVPIQPVALFGSPELVPYIRERAAALELTLFPSAQELYSNIQEHQKESTRRRDRKSFL